MKFPHVPLCLCSVGLLVSCGAQIAQDEWLSWDDETWSAHVDGRLESFKEPVLSESQNNYTLKFRNDGDFGKIFQELHENEVWMESFLDEKPSGLLKFCPNYEQLDSELRSTVWMSLFDALSFSESGYSTKLSFQEKFLDSEGDKVVSTGLFQLSFRSAQNHKETCSGATTEKLKDPTFSFACAVRVMANQVARRGVLFYEDSQLYYWSVLSKERNSNGFARFVGRMSQLIKDGERWPRKCALPVMK